MDIDKVREFVDSLSEGFDFATIELWGDGSWMLSISERSEIAGDSLEHLEELMEHGTVMGEEVL